MANVKVSTPFRSTATKFDDVPGELPKCQLPKEFNIETVTETAIARLNDLQTEALAETVVWRDLLALTGHYRTMFSQSRVHSTLRRLSKERQRSALSLKADSKPRVGMAFPGYNWIDVDVQFTVQHGQLKGNCHGTVSVAHMPDGQWQIWMLRTWLENFEGHGHADALEPKSQISANGVNGTSKPDDASNTYDAVIVGGGQSGLSTAGRLKALGLRYVVIDKRPEVGDVWSTRYDSLAWHTSTAYGALPFDLTTYPGLPEHQLPTKSIGAGHKAWAERYGINTRLSTTVEAARWEEKTRTWTVEITSPNGHEVLKTSNLVLATGTGFSSPVVPDWATPSAIAASEYKGTIMHSVSYTNATPWANKRGIVIGTANTAHDVAEDMANAHMHTTMMQRSPTAVLPMAWIHAGEDPFYNSNNHPADSDRRTFTYPNKIMRDMTNNAVRMAVDARPEFFDNLEKAGFRAERYSDVYNNLYVRFGGHYVDIGASARIAKGEIKVEGRPIKGLSEHGLLLQDGTELPADLIVICTGFNHDFREDATAIVGKEIAEQMDDFFGIDHEGELRALAKYAGRKSPRPSTHSRTRRLTIIQIRTCTTSGETSGYQDSSRDSLHCKSKPMRWAGPSSPI